MQKNRSRKRQHRVKGYESVPFQTPNELFIPADKEYIKKERQKAKELKKTRWWKNKLNAGECYYCGKIFSKEDLSMDHLVPLTRQGRTTKNNVVVACKNCNFEKKHKTLVEIRLNR